MSKQRDVASYLIGLIENGDRLIVNGHEYHADVVVRLILKRAPGTDVMEYVWNIESFASDPMKEHAALQRKYDVDGSGMIRSFYRNGQKVDTGTVFVSPYKAYLKGYGYV